MALLIDTSASFLQAGFTTGPSTLTNNYTVTGTNPGLYVWVAIWQDVSGTGAVTAATYNGVSLTLAKKGTPSGSMTGEWWYLANPPTGLHSLVITVTGAVDGIRVMPISFSGALQTSPLGATPVQASGSSGNPAVTITNGTSGSVVIAGLSRFANTAITATTWTNAQRANASSVTAAVDYLITSNAAAQTDTMTGSAAQDWVAIAIEVKAATGASVNNGAPFLAMMAG